MDETADKERYAIRPAALELLTLCQFLQWFRIIYRGEEEARSQELNPIRLVMAEDTPKLPHHSSVLPTTLTLEDDTVLRRLRRPRPVAASPTTSYSTIMLFKVI